MAAFVWAKMQAESGETLEQIVLRKDAERHSGDGVFWWGFGASLGEDVERAANENGLKLQVLFSKMLSPPKKRDSAPSAVYVWDGWQTKSGQGRIPLHVLVTGGGPSRGHYALVCSSPTSLELRHHGLFDPANCWTYKSRTSKGIEKQPGASQVVSLLWDRKPDSHSAGPYRLGFKATLTKPWMVRLTNGRQLSDHERAMIKAYQKGDDWMSLVRQIRK